MKTLVLAILILISGNMYSNHTNTLHKSPTITINFKSNSALGFSYTFKFSFNKENTSYFLANNKKERFFASQASSKLSRFQNINLNANEVLAKNKSLQLKSIKL